jgi:ABC-type uncharacterized transport system substrate-binding protein
MFLPRCEAPFPLAIVVKSVISLRTKPMTRRVFITLLGATATWSLAARAQQPAMPLIGFLNSGSPDGYAPMVAAFLRSLKEVGYIEGQSVAIEYRWLQGQYDHALAVTAELVRRQAAVIVANTPGVLAIKTATTIPIVFTTASDPVQIGLVASLSRPGGNITGVTQLGIEVASKRLELARELLPTATRIAVRGLACGKRESSDNVASLPAALVRRGDRRLLHRPRRHRPGALCLLRGGHAAALDLRFRQAKDSEARRSAAPHLVTCC